jgi:hypothetical protein
LTSPRLEVSDVDKVPFSVRSSIIIFVSIFMLRVPQHNFLDLFEELGLDISEPESAKDKSEGGPDFSYDIEVFSSILSSCIVD